MPVRTNEQPIDHPNQPDPDSQSQAPPDNLLELNGPQINTPEAEAQRVEIAQRREYPGTCCLECFQKFGYEFTAHVIPNRDPFEPSAWCPVCDKFRDRHPDLPWHHQ